MYQPTLGSFTARDPLSRLGDADLLYDNINLYTYSASNPIIYLDAMGLDPSTGEGSAWGAYEHWTDPKPITWFNYSNTRPMNIIKGASFDAGPKFSMADLSNGNLGAALIFTWKTDPAEYYDSSGCPKCLEYGIIQIGRYSNVFFTPYIGHTPGGRVGDKFSGWLYTKDWFLDSKDNRVPYQFTAGSNTIKSPNATGRFNDEPIGWVSSFATGLTLVHQQDFEAHFVCLRGNEAGISYGGFVWGYHIRMNHALYDPTTDGLAKAFQKAISFTSYIYPRDTPSSEWQRLSSAPVRD